MCKLLRFKLAQLKSSDSRSCLLHPAVGRGEGGEGVTEACSCVKHKASIERDRVGCTSSFVDDQGQSWQESSAVIIVSVVSLV